MNDFGKFMVVAGLLIAAVGGAGLVGLWPGLVWPFARGYQLHPAQLQFSFSDRDLPDHQPGFDAAHVVDPEMKVY